MSTLKDLTGRTFGSLTVLSRDITKTSHGAFWICHCSRCGKDRSIRGIYLTGPRAYQDCGCAWEEHKADLSGRTMGGVEVLRLLSIKRREQKTYCVRCRECGQEREMLQHDLLSCPRDCGCTAKAESIERLRKIAPEAVKRNLADGASMSAAYANEPLPTNTTGFRWVRWYPKRNCYAATFRVKGERYFKWGFDTPETAYKWALEEHQRVVEELGIPKRRCEK